MPVGRYRKPDHSVPYKKYMSLYTCMQTCMIAAYMYAVIRDAVTVHLQCTAYSVYRCPELQHDQERQHNHFVPAPKLN